MLLTSLTQKRLFILGSIIVLFLAVLLYIRINALMQSFRTVDHTNKIELNLEYTISYLKDAETGQRGFLLTQDSSFLQPYIGARKRIDSMLSEIKVLTKDNPQQLLLLDNLKDLIDRRFLLLDTTLKKAGGPVDSLRFDMELDKLSMNRIRDHVEQMKAIERGLLKTHENTKKYYEKLTPLSLLFLVFSIVVILGFSYYGLTKQLQQTRKYADDLDFLNNELLIRNKQLENSVEELNSFNYIASHDLKEPLRKILFFTDAIIINSPELSAEVKQHLDKIYTAGGRMKGLLDDLLTYAQASMGETSIVTTDLNALLNVVTENLSEMLHEKNASVTYKELPIIQAIPSQMQQLFENLITNSVKYSREGVPPNITISSNIISKLVLPASYEATHDQYYQILFSDNGIGFTQDNAEKIFVLFQRLHQRHEFSGTGIGLTICKKIVQNHNGFITAESEVNEGTTFFIYLPV